MRLALLVLLGLGLMLNACAGGGTPSGGMAQPQQLSSAMPGNGANAFNPYLAKALPNTRQTPAESSQMLARMGASAQQIELEARHRPHWREELYPVVFGSATAPHEVLVLLDFSEPKSEKVWNEVMAASRSLPANQCKIAVFGNSRENYGTDLLGFAIWIAHSRKGQAMPFLSYALSCWNGVKAAQRKAGTLKTFTNEYDATLKSTDYPIHYAYFPQLKPAIRLAQELEVAKYCYDAGNVNMYQTVQLCSYYGVKALPAVIVDGVVLPNATAGAIVDAMR